MFGHCLYACSPMRECIMASKGNRGLTSFGETIGTYRKEKQERERKGNKCGQ